MIFVAIYLFVAMVTLLVILMAEKITDGLDFLLVLPSALLGAMIWPLTLLGYGLYLVVRT